MTGQPEVLRVLLSNEELDDSELEVEALRLRDELLELDVVDVHHATSGPPPAGARGMDVGAIGQLLIDLSRTPELVSAVVGVVTGWLARSGNRKLSWIGAERQYRSKAYLRRRNSN